MNKMSNSNNKLNSLTAEKKVNRKKRAKKILLATVISLVSSFLLVVFGLNWQQSYTDLAYCNAFYFSGFILLIIWWMIIMTNKNILSPLVYGLKSFFLMFLAKKPKLDYYNYMQERKENPIPMHIVVTPFLASIPNFVIAIILHLNLG